jgi:hypothetical protein
MNRLNHIVAVCILFRTEATGDNHLAIFGQCFTDGIKRLLNRRINKSAGIDDDQIGTVIRLRSFITLCTKLGQDLLRINQCLRATEGDKSNFWELVTSERRISVMDIECVITKRDKR